MPEKKPQKVSSRFRVLDQLRGFFIVVIIVDHLSRWPSIWAAITGKAWLWVTAAEGFVIISGLLVGYIRGFKNRTLALKEVSKKLIGRAALLYLWAIIGTIVYTTFIWYVPLQGGAPGMPIAVGDWGELFWQSVSLQYTYVWVHFLKLYAIFMAAAPVAIWLLRQNRAWIVGLVSFALLILGWVTGSELLQWQFLFFIPVIAGFYLETILNWWQRLGQKGRALKLSIISLTAVTMTLSVIVTFYPSMLQAFAAFTTPIFAKESISLARAAMAFLWFGGLLFLFLAVQTWIGKWLGWLLETIGTRSLTAYILHGVALIVISSITMSGDNIVINSLLGILAVLIVWSLLKIPGINRVIPR